MSAALQKGAGASYREILRASALIGGSSLVGVVLRSAAARLTESDQQSVALALAKACML